MPDRTGKLILIMTMQEIKSYFGVSSLSFKRTLTEEGQETSWYTCWINELRVRINVNENVIKEIADDREFNKLSLKDDGEVISHSGQEYHKYYIVIYSDVDYVF